VRKQAPTFGRLLVVVFFTLSCVGMLFYLWFAFGGAFPFASRGYRVTIPFQEAGQLSVQADVRISGVPVGKVKHVDFDRERNVTDAVVEIDRDHAPLPADTRAILRQKSLLGETYVEITPGTTGGATIPEGGRMKPGAVGESVELDEIFRGLDARTRKDFQLWMVRQSQATDGRGRDISDALGNLAPVAEDSTDLLTTVNAQQGAVQRLVANTGVVFDALGERQDQLRSLISSSDRVSSTTAQRNAELEAVFRILPTFETESRVTLRALTEFGNDADPLVTQLRPASRELAPALQGVERIAPDVRRLFEGLGPLVDASERGLPAISAFLGDLEPLLGQLDPWLREANPALSLLGMFKNELNAFIANIVAVTQAVFLTDSPEQVPLHYARGDSALTPADLAPYPRRIGSNRTNPYPFPGPEFSIPNARVFDDRNCGRDDPALTTDAYPELLPDDLRALIATFVYGGQPADDVRAPACTQQPLFPAIGTSCAGVQTAYPHVCPDLRPRP
jgi:phospholipid/cholesterol/gamma-HCH transport system substrate-binding protein